jgi:hypothetical protein
MKDRLSEISTFISNIEGAFIITPLYDDGYIVKGTVTIEIKSISSSLDFDVWIMPQYPLKSHDNESIKFFNKELIQDYSHVMPDGSICIHTSHNTNLETKVNIDFDSLKRWIEKFYVNKDMDTHYEHLNIAPTIINNSFHAYLFTKVEYKFRKNEFGFLKYARISKGVFLKKDIYCAVITDFEILKNTISCQWSQEYRNSLIEKNVGVFIFLDNPPVYSKRDVIKNWIDLEQHVSQEFLQFFHFFEKEQVKKNRGINIPLFFGYRIPNGETHWEAALIEIGKFPIQGYKDGQTYLTEFIDKEIQWCITKNCSFEYFFGRGKFHSSVTKGKILIIGVGAIGSMIATTLTRGGCTSIHLADYDHKEPGNVCRSEYSFDTGITNKIDDLGRKLVSISPFVEIKLVDQDYFELFTKAFQGEEDKKKLKDFLSEYNLVFDCSTDNDLLYVLNALQLPNLISISITNEATALVCATEPNSYKWVLNQFENVLEYDREDLYNPTGCWSPTFKASYNDINTLVQFALKQINLKFEQGKPLKNFVLQTNTASNFNINLKEF